MKELGRIAVTLNVPLVSLLSDSLLAIATPGGALPSEKPNVRVTV